MKNKLKWHKPMAKVLFVVGFWMQFKTGSRYAILKAKELKEQKQPENKNKVSVVTSVKKITSIYILPVTADVQAAVLPQYSKVSRGVFSLILHIQVLSTLIKNLQQKMLHKWFSISNDSKYCYYGKSSNKKGKKNFNCTVFISIWQTKHSTSFFALVINNSIDVPILKL